MLSGTGLPAPNIDLPLARRGFEGRWYSLHSAYVDTGRPDPYIFRNGPLSGDALFSFSSEFRQNLGKFVWGVSISGNMGAVSYRRTETDNGQNASPSLSAFAEYRPSRQTLFRRGVGNPGGQANRRLRHVRAADRISLNPAIQKYRERRGRQIINFPVKPSFAQARQGNAAVHLRSSLKRPWSILPPQSSPSEGT